MSRQGDVTALPDLSLQPFPGFELTKTVINVAIFSAAAAKKRGVPSLQLIVSIGYFRIEAHLFAIYRRSLIFQPSPSGHASCQRPRPPNTSHAPSSGHAPLGQARGAILWDSTSWNFVMRCLRKI